ncbi:hypothetical protein ACNOYE_33915 [Nannocystaceae bacterium ST9]
MTSRASVVVLGLSLLACRMDNPAFEGGDELAGASEGSGNEADSGDEADAITGSEVGSEAGSEQADTSEVTTDAECNPGDACGECHVCDEVGACVPRPGSICDEVETQCGEFVFGLSDGTCYALAAGSLPGRCSENGVCKPAPMDCPLQKGEDLAVCDKLCVNDSGVCTAMQPAAGVSVESLCVLQGETLGCHSTCTDLMTSVQHRQCSNGFCDVQAVEVCLPYLCDAQVDACLMGCEDDPQCADGFFCELGICLPG